MIQYQDTLFFLYGFLLAICLTPFVIRCAVRYGILDIPFGTLKVHKTPTPYLGGVLIYLAFFLPLCFLWPNFSFYATETFFLFLGLTGFLLLGLYDDIFVITPVQKFVGQICFASILLYAGYCIKPSFFSEYIVLALALFIILSVVNAFNLVDVMDGLATTLALSSATMFLLVAYLQQVSFLFSILLLFIGALIGFLWWNKPAAKIYLGDAGALFLGACLSITPFFLSWSEKTSLGYFVPLTFISLPLLEVTFLIIVRLLLSIRPWQGSPHHFSILLQKKGWSKPMILCWAFGINILFGLVGLGFMQGYCSFFSFLVSILFLVGYWIFIVFDRGLLLFELLKKRVFILNN